MRDSRRAAHPVRRDNSAVSQATKKGRLAPAVTSLLRPLDDRSLGACLELRERTMPARTIGLDGSTLGRRHDAVGERAISVRNRNGRRTEHLGLSREHVGDRRCGLVVGHQAIAKRRNERLEELAASIAAEQRDEDLQVAHVQAGRVVDGERLADMLPLHANRVGDLRLRQASATHETGEQLHKRLATRTTKLAGITHLSDCSLVQVHTECAAHISRTRGMHYVVGVSGRDTSHWTPSANGETMSAMDETLMRETPIEPHELRGVMLAAHLVRRVAVAGAVAMALIVACCWLTGCSDGMPARTGTYATKWTLKESTPPSSNYDLAEMHSVTAGIAMTSEDVGAHGSIGFDDGSGNGGNLAVTATAEGLTVQGYTDPGGGLYTVDAMQLTPDGDGWQGDTVETTTTDGAYHWHVVMTRK